MGKIASYYYIDYTTIEIFSKSLNEPRKLTTLFEILCSASEFESINMRYNEVDILTTFLGDLVNPLPTNAKLNDPHTKCNILLQLYLSRVPISIELRND